MLAHYREDTGFCYVPVLKSCRVPADYLDVNHAKLSMGKRSGSLKHAVLRSLLLFWIVLIAAAYAFPQFRVAVLAAVGRNRGCSEESRWTASQNVFRQDEIAGELARGSRIIKEDRGLTLWELAGGERYWVPKGSQKLPEMRAEQKRRVYGSGQDSVHPDDIVLDCGANVGLFSATALLTAQLA